MPIRSETLGEVRTWEITPEQLEKIERLNATSEWLRRPSVPETFRPYRGKYVAARDCKIIAAAATYEELRSLLKNESPGTYMVASFKGGRMRFDPS